MCKGTKGRSNQFKPRHARMHAWIGWLLSGSRSIENGAKYMEGTRHAARLCYQIGYMHAFKWGHAIKGNKHGIYVQRKTSPSTNRLEEHAAQGLLDVVNGKKANVRTWAAGYK